MEPRPLPSDMYGDTSDNNDANRYSWRLQLPALNNYFYLALFLGLPHFLFLGKWKSGEQQRRPGNTYHINDVKWMQHGHRSYRNRNLLEIHP